MKNIIKKINLFIIISLIFGIWQSFAFNNDTQNKMWIITIPLSTLTWSQAKIFYENLDNKLNSNYNKWRNLMVVNKSWEVLWFVDVNNNFIYYPAYLVWNGWTKTISNSNSLFKAIAEDSALKQRLTTKEIKISWDNKTAKVLKINKWVYNNIKSTFLSNINFIWKKIQPKRFTFILNWNKINIPIYWVYNLKDWQIEYIQNWNKVNTKSNEIFNWKNNYWISNNLKKCLSNFNNVKNNNFNNIQLNFIWTSNNWKIINSKNIINSIEVINCVNQNIKNINWLKIFKNLKYLDLYNNQIKDISSLKYLTNLRQIFLWYNQIKDINSLKYLTNLKELYLWDNHITNITPLQNLTKLTNLYLWNNNITNITPLQNLTNLVWLALDNNQIKDITPLTNLTNLTNFSLYGNNKLWKLATYYFWEDKTNITDKWFNIKYLWRKISITKQ